VLPLVFSDVVAWQHCYNTKLNLQPKTSNQVERAPAPETCRKRLARSTEGALQGYRPQALRASMAIIALPSETKHVPFSQTVLREKGLEAISVEELVKEITPRGRATVPDSLKAELLQRIRKFLAEN
jgi:hypothetical protein